MPQSQNVTIQEAVNYHQQGKLAEAEKIYLQILNFAPYNKQAMFLLGSLYGQRQQYAKSIQLLEKVIEIDTRNLDAYNNLALVYELNGDLKKAIETCESALRQEKKSAVLHNNLGDLYQKCKNYEKAKKHLELALALKPDYESALINSAILFCQLQDYEQSEHLFNRALQLNPNNAKTYCNYAALKISRESYKDAELLAREAIALQDNYSQAFNNLGNALLKQENYKEAEKNFKKAIELMPNYIDAYNNLGLLYHNTARFNDALDIYNQAIKFDRTNHNSYWYRSFTQLMLGNFKQAWTDYEHGLQIAERDKRIFPYKPWNLSTDASKSLLIYAEQGVGDQIMFASCLPDILKTHQKIVLECEHRLQPLFQRSFPAIQVIGTKQNSDLSWLNKYPQLEYQLAIGSLANFYRNKLEDFPVDNSYLVVDDAKKLTWKKRFSTLGGGLKIGISWQGGIKVEHQKRSMTLESWLSILKTPDCHFINLQYGIHQQEIEDLKLKYNITIHDWPDSDSLQNLDDFAAQIAALDLVISVGNTNVHLAGALGRPAWCLIPKVPSWRWMTSGNRSPWYSSVKIYRQKHINDWSPVIDEVTKDLSLLK